MNKKGQMKGVGTIIIIAIGIIVALVILVGGITKPVGDLTTLSKVTNTTIAGTSWRYGTSIDLIGQAVTNAIATNATGGETVPATNYTITSRTILSDGTLGSKIAVGAGSWNSTAVNLSYTYEPLGYAPDAASRTVVGLIIIFSVLAVLVFTINGVTGGELFKMIGSYA